jgi:hypothetical protein
MLWCFVANKVCTKRTYIPFGPCFCLVLCVKVKGKVVPVLSFFSETEYHAIEAYWGVEV